MEILNSSTNNAIPSGSDVNEGFGFWHALKKWQLRGFFALVDQGLISG